MAESGLAAGLQALGQGLAPQNFIGALNQMEQFNQRRVRQQAFQDSVKDLDFRASRDPALLKRVNNLRKMHPQAFADPESYARFSSDLTQYEAGEELIDMMQAKGQLQDEAVLKAWKAKLGSDPGSVINSVTTFLQGQESLAMQMNLRNEMERKFQAESDVRSFGLSNEVDRLRDALQNPNDITALRDSIAADPNIAQEDKQLAFQVADGLIKNALSIQGAEERLPSAQAAVSDADQAAADQFVSSPGFAELSFSEQLAALPTSGLGAGAQRAALQSLATSADARSQEARQQIAAFEAQLQAQKQQQDFLEKERERLNELGVTNENVSAALNTIEQEEGVTIASVEELEDVDPIVLDDALKNTGLDKGTLRQFLQLRELDALRQGSAAQQRRFNSANLLDSREDLVAMQDTGIDVGRGGKKRRKMQPILRGSNQFNNAFSLSNTKAQQATKDGDLEGQPVLTRLVVPTDLGDFTAVQNLDNSVTGFGVKPNGDVVIHDMVDDGQGNLTLGAVKPEAVFLQEVQAQLPEDRPMSGVKSDVKAFRSFLEGRKDPSPEVQGILEGIKSIEAQIAIDPDDEEQNILNAAKHKAQFIKLRQRYDSAITNAKLRN